MEPQRLDTSSFAGAEQYEAWLSWFDGVFHIDPAQSPEAGFRATSEVWSLGGCVLSRVFAPGARVIRNKTLISRNPIDHWAVAIGRDTITTVSAGRHVFQTSPHVPFIVSLGSEMAIERDEDLQRQLYLSRDTFSSIAPVLDASCGAIVNGAMGTMLADYILLLERSVAGMSEDDLPRLRLAISAMIAACVAPTPDRVAEATEQIDLGRLDRVRRAVRKHLRSHLLGPRLLCRCVGTSRSQLYRLLEPEGGVARYIRRQRLLVAYAMLADPAVDQPIAQIAEELCFADGSGFSRAFRQEFDISPTDLRAAARSGCRPLARLNGHNGVRPTTLNDLLRAP